MGWSINDFTKYLEHAHGPGTYETKILPQIRAIVCDLFHALGKPPTALASEESGDGRKIKLRRLGFDLLIDANFGVWLIEVNFLKNGYVTCYAAKGPAGDAKRRLV